MLSRDCVTWVWINSGELSSTLCWRVFMKEGESIKSVVQHTHTHTHTHIYIYIYIYIRYVVFNCLMTTNDVEKKLEDNFTRMLQAVLSKPRKQHPTNSSCTDTYPHLTLVWASPAQKLWQKSQFFQFYKKWLSVTTTKMFTYSCSFCVRVFKTILTHTHTHTHTHIYIYIYRITSKWSKFQVNCSIISDH